MDLITQCLEDDSIWEEVGNRTGLTPAAVVVMRLACKGMDTGQIAKTIDRNQKTVAAHKVRAHRRFDVACLEGAIRKCLAVAVEIHIERQHGQL